LSKSSGTN